MDYGDPELTGMLGPTTPTVKVRMGAEKARRMAERHYVDQEVIATTRAANERLDLAAAGAATSGARQMEELVQYEMTKLKESTRELRAARREKGEEAGEAAFVKYTSRIFFMLAKESTAELDFEIDSTTLSSSQMNTAIFDPRDLVGLVNCIDVDLPDSDDIIYALIDHIVEFRDRQREKDEERRKEESLQRAAEKQKAALKAKYGSYGGFWRGVRWQCVVSDSHVLFASFSLFLSSFLCFFLSVVLSFSPPPSPSPGKYGKKNKKEKEGEQDDANAESIAKAKERVAEAQARADRTKSRRPGQSSYKAATREELEYRRRLREDELNKDIPPNRRLITFREFHFGFRRWKKSLVRAESKEAADAKKSEEDHQADLRAKGAVATMVVGGVFATMVNTAKAVRTSARNLLGATAAERERRIRRAAEEIIVARTKKKIAAKATAKFRQRRPQKWPPR